MKFKSGTRRRALEYEKDVVAQWKKNKTFEKSVAMRPADNAYVFYDGPPFISGVPHHGTLLSSIVKDAVPRYQTMKGKRVERVWGWDCHGLPAETYTEKKLGIKGKQEVLDYGLENYITAVRDNMNQTSAAWEDTIDRIGRWVDFKGAYKTMDKDYMESVWWAFKTLYEKGKIYEGEKVLMYCTQDATPLSKAEVTMDSGAYQDVTDPSVFVKFKLIDNDAYLLAWTTTPWTLPANTAVAVNKDFTYVEVLLDNEKLILAKDLAEKVLTNEKHQPLDYKVIRELSGAELVGKKYEPLLGVDRGENAQYVWHADYVSDENGSGIVHIAPAYGEEDFVLAQENKIPVVHTIDATGHFTEGEWRDEYVWDINKTIAKTLHERGAVWKIEYVRHSYPHCHRCGTKLMYRAHPSWFMDIANQREQMLIENTEHINWFPPHFKHGRFEKTVQSAPDWNLSRDRFWATPMPVWKGTDKDGKMHVKVIGSYDELEQLSGRRLSDYHRPWIDDVTFEVDGVHYERIDKVMDSWFEAGSMPFAQFHYPFENVKKFEENFPGDFIVEYVGQVRAWFYYVHAVSVGLFGQNAFKNVVVTGTVAGNDGRKMSKSYGNFTDPNELMDTYSADSLRFLLLQSPLLNGEDFALHDKDVADVARKLSMVWNMYDFFTMYAEVDGWEFTGDLSDPTDELENPLDQWIVSRVHQLNKEVESHMDGYDIPNAMKPILPFIEDASNWYVRRSRRRFWKSGDTTDKNNAYRTLHYVLTHLAQVMAPFTPFLAEELYQKLTDGESVHLQDWPTAGHVNELVVKDMETVREYVNIGLSIRAKERVKVRQPLASVTVPSLGEFVRFEDILTEELNVKVVKVGSEVVLDLTLTPELKREGMMREVIRHVQSARKNAGLNVDDRIALRLETGDKNLQEAIREYSATIEAETLAKLTSDETHVHEMTVKVEGAPLSIAMQKRS
ncbi:isoleucine--tRNA ligase [Streptomyces caniscabiei]|uniref:isoleucine--tRNA ligase n=1 Tax=Streptomyces caniscabiei TaxID=2746961 RepID=UPI0029A3E7F8|nr:isoleucine--tRNA ligase [Streptomyces caniscabiei]MDX2776242.1 isoleucine--tRNA ligase [Streptomyces caniscabiei]